MPPLPAPHLPTNPDDLTALPITARGLGLLRVLVQAEDTGDGSGWVHSHNLFVLSTWPGRNITGDLDQYLHGISEAWAWLVAEGLIAHRPEQRGPNSHFVTQHGRDLLRDPDPQRRLFAEEVLGVDLHPRIAERVRNQFLLGEAELAAFAAMREVEIRVRQLYKGSTTDIGVRLMRDAFGQAGPLRRADRDPGEQQALADLFAGAIGVFKNPSSHREVDYADPTVASEVILLADLLLRLLDQE